MNIPYVKQYENGILINKLTGHYMHDFQNRQQRRKTDSSQNNRKSVKGRKIQIINLKDKKGNFTGKQKFIQHSY